VETKPTRLRLPRQERRPQQACFKESYIYHCYPYSSFVQISWDGDAGLWLTLMPFMSANNFCNFLCFGYVLNVVLDSN
jgi:glycopeptide antibiotics resistance protein